MMSPDFVWETMDGKRIVMVAKFRLQNPWPPLDDESGDVGIDSVRATTDDLTKMHDYCDAIDGVTAAIVFYPGTQERFHDIAGTQQGISLEKVITGDVEGIGAVPMSPVTPTIDEGEVNHD